MYFTITGAKILVRFTEDYANRGSLYRGSTVRSLHAISTHYQPIVVKLFSNFTERDNRVKSSFKAFFPQKIFRSMHRACFIVWVKQKEQSRQT